MSIDFDHMRTLHEECIEQLQLMQTALESAQLASDTIRDKLDDMANHHWHTYIDVVHLISMHDETMNTSLKQVGLDLRTEDDTNEAQCQIKRSLILTLVAALVRRHQRMIYVYNLHGEPMKDFLSESTVVERDCMASIISMIHTTL
jgi:hypothetical protein